MMENSIGEAAKVSVTGWNKPSCIRRSEQMEPGAVAVTRRSKMPGSMTVTVRGKQQ